MQSVGKTRGELTIPDHNTNCATIAPPVNRCCSQMVHPFRCYGSEGASAHPSVRQVIDKAKAAVAEAFMPPQGNHTYIPGPTRRRTRFSSGGPLALLMVSCATKLRKSWKNLRLRPKQYLVTACRHVTIGRCWHIWVPSPSAGIPSWRVAFASAHGGNRSPLRHRPRDLLGIIWERQSGRRLLEGPGHCRLLPPSSVHQHCCLSALVPSASSLSRTTTCCGFQVVACVAMSRLSQPSGIRITASRVWAICTNW